MAAPTAPSVVLPTLVAGVVVTAGSALLAGADGAAGGLVALGLVVGFFLAGRLPLLVPDRVPPPATFLLLGFGYLARIVLLVVVLVALRDASWVHPETLGVAVVLLTFVWAAAALRSHVRSRRPLLDLSDPAVHR